MVSSGVTSERACEEYLHWLEHDRQRKPTTLRDYRSTILTHLLSFCGAMPVEDITEAHAELWHRQLTLATTTKIKVMTIFFGVMERARRRNKLPLNPAKDLEKPILRRMRDIEVFSPEEVMALVRAADSEQDAAI
jgi:integrase